MRVDDVVDRLTACGLGEKEARALAHLTHLGSSKVTDLAKAAGLKRPETYQLLERLQSRGLVEGTLSRPRTFTAVAPERVMAILHEERAAGLKAIDAMRDELVERLGRLGSGVEKAAGETFRVLHDRNQINGQLARTVRASRKEVCLIASSRSLFRLLLDEGLEKELRDARGRDVDVRILTEVLPGQEENVARLAEFAHVRHMMVPRPLRYLTADEREIVQYVIADPLNPGAKETALWIGARDHVQAQRAFFDDLWTAAMPAASRAEELRTGRASEQVQVVKGRLTRYEKQKDMMLRAERAIDLRLPAGEAARLAPSGLARVLASRLREGARVRVLVPAGAKLDLPGAQVRALRGGDAGLPLLLVDDAEALLALLATGATEAVTEVAEHGLWVSLRPTVEALRSGFEKEWEAAAAGEDRTGGGAR